MPAPSPIPTAPGSARPEPVHAVIVTWNAERWLDKTLASLRAAPALAGTVVVDNASTDGTLALVRSRFPEVHLVALEHNAGFGTANNRGISWALQQGAQSVLLLNQDAWLAPDALPALLRVRARHPDYGILSPVHLNGSGTRFDHGFADYVRATSWLEDQVLQRVQAVYPVPFINAAAWLVSRDCLLAVGGFDPLFFMYGEDNDFCSRTTFQGFAIGVVPAALAHHDREDRRAAAPADGCLADDRVLAWTHLMHLKDVSRSFRRELGQATRLQLRYALEHLAHARWRRAGGAFALLGRLWARAPRIWRHKRLCYQPGPHWLTL